MSLKSKIKGIESEINGVKPEINEKMNYTTS